MDIDFDRALLLLTVVEKSLGHPKLRPIVAAASDELEAMIAPPKEETEQKIVEDVDVDASGAQPDPSNKGMRRAFPARSESEKGSG